MKGRGCPVPVAQKMGSDSALTSPVCDAPKGGWKGFDVRGRKPTTPVVEGSHGFKDRSREDHELMSKLKRVIRMVNRSE